MIKPAVDITPAPTSATISTLTPTRSEIVASLCELRQQLRIQLHQTCPSLASFISDATLPAHLWASHPEFAEMHSTYVECGEALRSLVRL